MKKRKTPFWEDVVVILAIFTLWPSVLSRETYLTKSVMFAALMLLIWILARRIRRMKNLS